MKILPTLLLMLLPFYVFGVYGCSDDNSGDEQIQKFTLAEVDLQQNFTKEKGELSIPVSTTLDASRWDVASNQDWCIAAKDLSTSKPSIKILVKASEEPEIREAVVTVKSLVKNYEIHVKQLGYGPALLVKSSVSTLEAEGGEVIVTVTSNIEYAVEKSAEGDWLQAVEAFKILPASIYVLVENPICAGGLTAILLNIILPGGYRQENVLPGITSAEEMD